MTLPGSAESTSALERSTSRLASQSDFCAPLPMTTTQALCRSKSISCQQTRCTDSRWSALCVRVQLSRSLHPCRIAHALSCYLASFLVPHISCFHWTLSPASCIPAPCRFTWSRNTRVSARACLPKARMCQCGTGRSTSAYRVQTVSFPLICTHLRLPSSSYASRPPSPSGSLD